MIKIKDFEREDGSTDWDAYHKAEMANGDRCMTCGCYIIPIVFQDTHGPRECNSCRNMISDDGEVSHDSRVRCPHCGKITKVDDLAEYGIYEEGELEMNCEECEKEFTVQVQVSYSYTSPERIQRKNDNVEGTEGKGEGNN